MTDDGPRFNGAGDDLWEKHATENELRVEVLRLSAACDRLETAGAAYLVRALHAEQALDSIARAQPLSLPRGLPKVWDCPCGERIEIADDQSCSSCGHMFDSNEGNELYELYEPSTPAPARDVRADIAAWLLTDARFEFLGHRPELPSISVWLAERIRTWGDTESEAT